MRYTERSPIGPTILAEGLHKSYGSQVVLDGLDLQVTDQVHALLGPNGAGKTTLINILSTLIPADRGTARILGLDLRRHRRAVQRSISLTGQFAAVDELLSGTENIVMMARLLGLSARAARARTGELLEQFDLTGAANKPAGTYSGGMRRRLDLAISMICAPQVLFLDEPTTGLDTRSRQRLWDQIRTLADGGTTVLLTTQYLEEADVLADRVSVLDDGVIVAEGSPAELKAGVGGAVLQLHDDEDRLTREVTTDGSLTDVSASLAALAAEHSQDRVSLRRPSMDEVFLHLTGQGRKQAAGDETADAAGSASTHLAPDTTTRTTTATLEGSNR